ncbi:MAG TPA: T9SS type A sorting domain-containing protein [Chryseolinea sp.]|nr:T9SS type A sorting domain-containing protein [Chryseolinea sp.]
MHNKFFGVVAIFLIQWQTDAQTLSKTQLTIFPEPNVYSHIEWVDVDGDNDMDLVELYSDPADDSKSFVKVYQNTNGTYDEKLNAFSVASIDPRSYAFNDPDGDGDVDFLFLDNEGIKIAINNGNFAFVIENTTISNPNNWHTEIHWQDLDRDQDLDIIFDIFTYMNVAGVYHQALHNMPVYTRNRSWADVNNDGYLDMVATKGQNGIDPLFLFINQGDGLFKESKLLSPGFLDLGETQWLDADADGDLDLFITEDGEKCTLFENKFSLSGVVDLQRAVSFKTLSNPKADVGDLNLDGLPDLIITGQGFPRFETYLYRNSSTSEEIKFVETDLEINPYYVSNFKLVDIDTDLDLDLFVFGWNDGEYSERTQEIYNINPGSTRPQPAVPSNLTSIVGEQVALSWDHNPDQGAAFYDLALVLDGVPFTSGVALHDGYLLMPDVINFHAAKQLTLQNLPPGNYEWRVQAFDHAHRSSGFSEPGSFTVVEAPTALALDVLAYNKVELTWQYGGTATAFAILRRSTNGALTEIGTVPGNTLIFVDSAVPPNEHVEYVVKAVSNGSYSAPSITVAYYSAQFDELPFNPAGPNVITAAGTTADFDQDQDFDIGFVGRIDNLDGTSKLLSNNGSGTYSGLTFLPAGEVLAGPIITRDMDNDGDIDVCVIVGNAGVGRKVAVYKNNGSSFTKSFETSAYEEVSQLASEDMNHDGLPDLMIKRTAGNSEGSPITYQLLYQTTANNFIDSKVIFLKEPNTAGGLGNFYLADLNNDGFTDVIFSGTGPVKAKLFVSLSGNAFKETSFGLSSLDDPAFFDFNGDGKMDIMQRGLQVLYLYNGMGGAQFSEPQEISIAGIGANESIQTMIADMDFNGWPDLIVNDFHNTTLLYNKGQGNFVRADYQFAGNPGTHVFLTDMEGDGDLDLVKQGNDDYDQGINYYYKNRSISAPGQNASPTVVAGIQVSRSANATTLSWQPATDDTTPAAMISYHLDLMDGNGKHWIHRETNASGTFRRRLAYGNAGFRTSFTINDLPAGHYTANIHAVDATFKLSASSALSFDVTAGPTLLAVERILLNKVKLTWTDGPLNGTATIVTRKSLTSDFQIVAELPANATTYTDSGLQYDNLYTYQVYEKSVSTITTGSNAVNWNTALLVLEQSTITNATGSLDVGDYTADGKMDMLIFGGRMFNGNTIDLTSALLEKTSGGWTQQNAGSVTLANPGTSHFYDINGDHRLDLYQHGYSLLESEYETNVLLNNGNKTFTSTTNSFTSDYFGILETWDYDRDNDLDYYVMKPGVGTSLIKNNGAGVFNKDTDFAKCCSNGLVSGDFDKDGDEDLIHFDQTSNYYTLFLNKEGSLEANMNIQVSGGRMQKLDYNGDGWPDLLFVQYNGFNVKTELYKNLGANESGVIQFKVIKDDFPVGEVSVNTADYDHDGDLDIFFTGKPCVMYNNEGDDTFKENLIPNFSAGTNNTQWVDFDSDGDLDLFMTGYFTVDYVDDVDQPYGYVLKNQLIVSGKGVGNLAPDAPTNLSSHQDTEGLHLTWSNQPDDHTAPTALSHDVIIYKDGKEIMKAPLNPLTGARLKLQEGRASESLIVDNLAYGSYTWKVQALDQTFMGSPLSAQADFIFLPQAPGIKDTVVYKCDRQVTLTAEGANIEWYTDGELTNKVASGVYSPQTSQKVYVTQTIAGMRGVARPVQITILDRPPMPVATLNPYFYCENSAGSSANLVVSGKNVMWFKDADKKINAGSGNQLSIMLSEQNFYATQNIGQCESLPAIVAVKPLVIDSEINFEDDKIYTAEQDGSSYQWYRNNSPVPNSNNYILEGAVQGDTYKVYIEKGGCSETSAPTIITGIEDKEISGLRIFPNPAHDNFTIDMVSINGFVKIYDAAGRVVFEKTVQDNSQGSLLVPSSAWSDGVYFITINTGQNIISRKVVIK